MIVELIILVLVVVIVQHNEKCGQVESIFNIDCLIITTDPLVRARGGATNEFGRHMYVCGRLLHAPCEPYVAALGRHKQHTSAESGRLPPCAILLMLSRSACRQWWCSTPLRRELRSTIVKHSVAMVLDFAAYM